MAATQRTTVIYPAKLRRGLKTLAVQSDTTVAALVRAAVAAGVSSPSCLVQAAPAWERASGARTTLDLDAAAHKKLKMLAAEHDTTVQALVLAAVTSEHPELLK